MAEKIKAADLRNKNDKELRIMLEDRDQELMNLRFSRAVARLEKPARMKQLKRERARIHTIMTEKRTAEKKA